MEAIVEAVNSPEPPKHLLLGKIALQRFRTHLEQWNESLNKWQDVTTGADFQEGEHSLTASPYTGAKA